MTAQLDRVRVQFPLPRSRIRQGRGQYRLGRTTPQTLPTPAPRGFFRLEIPGDAHMLHCRLTIARPDGSPLLEEFRVLDLSAAGRLSGGSGTTCPLFRPGTVTGRCRIAPCRRRHHRCIARVCSANAQTNRGAPMLPGGMQSFPISRASSACYSATSCGGAAGNRGTGTEQAKPCVLRCKG